MTKRPILLTFVLLASLGLLACGDDLTDATSYSSIELALSPDPTEATASSDPDFEWQTTVTLTLAESNGVGATISAVAGGVTESSGGIAISSSGEEEFRTVVSSASNRVEANATTTITVQFFYTLPNGGREALVAVAVSVTDDAGASYSLSSQVTAS